VDATTERSAIDFEQRELVLRADFDLLDDDNCARVSLRFMHGLASPEPGDVVYLIDELGRGCPGTVDRIDGHYLVICPDWSAFTGGQLPSSVTSRPA
jgi:hypothetical protein